MIRSNGENKGYDTKKSWDRIERKSIAEAMHKATVYS